jgi:hypothetical protein
VNDLAKPETRVAISARGEIVHVMLVEPLLKRNLEFDSMTVIEMPGSGARVSALLSDRIDAGNVHFDQVAAIADQGNFQVLRVAYFRYRSRYQSKSLALRNAMSVDFSTSTRARSLSGSWSHSERTTQTSFVQPANSFHGSIRTWKLP